MAAGKGANIGELSCRGDRTQLSVLMKVGNKRHSEDMTFKSMPVVYRVIVPNYIFAKSLGVAQNKRKRNVGKLSCHGNQTQLSVRLKVGDKRHSGDITFKSMPVLPGGILPNYMFASNRWGLHKISSKETQSH